MISEEWSSDCRRDVPMVARLAEAGSLELRIFTRDGAGVGRGPRALPDETPNADLVNAFLSWDGRRPTPPYYGKTEGMIVVERDDVAYLTMLREDGIGSTEARAAGKELFGRLKTTHTPIRLLPEDGYTTDP